jgi:riboflavin synthase
MFTGLVAATGTVSAVERRDGGARLSIATPLAGELAGGDSVAVNGVCLTARSSESGSFAADVMAETLRRSSLGPLAAGDEVNLELPVRAGGRLGGHVVQGHVDGTGTVASIEPDGFARRLRVELPEDLLGYVVERGSIAIEGVSLTVAALAEGAVEVSLIPETLERTTLGSLEPGDRVNVECDVMARYVRSMMPKMST